MQYRTIPVYFLLWLYMILQAQISTPVSQQNQPETTKCKGSPEIEILEKDQAHLCVVPETHSEMLFLFTH